MDDKQAERVASIIAVYESATEDERLQGKRWYSDARDWCADTAKTYGKSLATVAGMVAAASPNLAWSRNKQVVEIALSEGKARGTFGKNCAKMDEIMTGRRSPLKTLKGDKVRNFYVNILTRGLIGREVQGTLGLTMDRHAVNIAENRELPDAERLAMIRTAKRYREYVDAYRAAAQILGIPPAILQAVTWVAWRNRFTGRVR